MSSIFLFLKPTLLKGILTTALVPVALALNFLTFSPFEGSAREGSVSVGTKAVREVGRRLIFIGIYKDIRRAMDRYFQPTGAWEPAIGFGENKTWGARLLKTYLPNVPFSLPGKALGFFLGAIYFYLLACVIARLSGR
jgi:hypothetical protein